MWGMASNQTDFSVGSVSRRILELALPMTAAQIINLLYNMVDRMYIGRIPGTGTLALTGLGLCFPVISIVSAFANLFGMGGAPLCSIARGKGNVQEAEKIMGTSFAMLLLSGAVLTIVGIAVHKPILYAFGASDATYPYAGAYCVIYLAGTIFVMISLGMNSFINSQGFGRIGMMTVLLGAVLNIALDPVFIFILDMGVRGAALATVLSQLVSALWVFHFLTGKKAILHLRWGKGQIEWRRLKEIVTLGLSGFVMSITNSATQIVCNASLQKYGGDLYVGVMTIINSVREILTMPVTGLTNGATPVLGYNYGAGRPDRIRKAEKHIVFLGLAFTAVMFVIAQTAPGYFVRIFTRDESYVGITEWAIRMYTLAVIPLAVQYTVVDGFTGMGIAKVAVSLSMFRKFVYFMGMLFLPMLFGVEKVFFAEPISDMVACVLSSCTYLLLSGRVLGDNRRL